ncbi:MAG: hypothetical protein M1828_005461 [Chrysothrix sp. TS-e1954]|nr:MAG: hypothetical protein M1828_005461 [Chrysothrix sp. TS-e1954]
MGEYQRRTHDAVTISMQALSHNPGHEAPGEHSWYSNSSATQDHGTYGDDAYKYRSHEQDPLSLRDEGTNSSQGEMQDSSDVSGPIPDNQRHPVANALPEQPWRGPTRGIEEEENKDLTELAAPEPAQEEDHTRQWRREQHLESSRRSQFAPVTDSDSRSKAATQLYIVSYLIFFSFMGTLARLGVQWLTFYNGAPVVIDNLWANFGGTLVMGFLTEDRKLFKEEWGARAENGMGDRRSSSEEHRKTDRRGSPEARAAHGKIKKTIPMFIGLATGFCGSFTSYSTFMRDAFFALSNDLPSPLDHPTALAQDSVSSTVSRNNGYSLAAILAVWILTVACSMAALMMGAHIAIGLDNVTPVLPFRFLRRIVDPLFVFLAFGCWLGVIFLSIFPPDRHGGPAGQPSTKTERWRGEVIFALVFAPLGCLLRFYLSLKLNGIIPSFPLGTFTANMFGTAVLAMSYDFQHVSLSSAPGLIGGGLVGCQALQGIEDGFCGCLTTVSTWIVELDTLRRRHAYVYGAMSILAGTALMVVIMGSVKWSIGFSQPACVTSNS